MVTHAFTGPGMALGKPSTLAVAVPFCAIAVVVVADPVSGPQVALLPVLSLGPALARSPWARYGPSSRRAGDSAQPGARRARRALVLSACPLSRWRRSPA
jgi:hypothetical protein